MKCTDLREKKKASYVWLIFTTSSIPHLTPIKKMSNELVCDPDQRDEAKSHLFEGT